MTDQTNDKPDDVKASEATSPAESKPAAKSKPRPKPKDAAKSGSEPRKVPDARSHPNAVPTRDEQHAKDHGGKPATKPAKTEGRQIELGDRVKLHTHNPIEQSNENLAYVIGFNAKTGYPNLRVEATTPALMTPREFGNVPQNKADDPTGPYWTWPDGAGAAK